MGTNLITLFMGSQYLVAGQDTTGLQFNIGEAKPNSLFERMVNDHLSTIVSFFKTSLPFKNNLAYLKLASINSIGIISYYLSDMGNVVFLNTSRYSANIPEYVVYLPHQLDKNQKRHIHKLLERNKDAKFTILFNLKLDKDGIPTGDTLFDVSVETFLEII